ncbi:Phox homologous domain-containing protein [Gorgonomyces haynaldii]|nr:Phox homologous domain-containing protein [Gorgonomyces haynaldii]
MNRKHKRPPPVINLQRGSSHPAGIFNMPPKKVVKANRNYTAKFAGELSFQKGDFFYVIAERNDGKYEVMNPVQRVRGVVPVDCFDSLDKVQGNHRESLSPIATSPRSPRTSNPKSPLPWEETIHSVMIQNVEQKQDGQWYYTIEVKFIDRTSHILFRTYEDFHILHLSLLNFFPAESGRTGTGRVIPFLQDPVKNMSQTEANRRKNHLDNYLQEFIHMPSTLLNASQTKRFFLLRNGDLNTSISIKFDASETLMDLLADYEDDDTVRITLILGEEVLNWEESVDLKYDHLMQTVEDYLGFRFRALLYKDETGTMIPLTGDHDLYLLIRTNKQNLVFFVS